MPELPDIEVYLHALRARVMGKSLTSLALRNPFVLRTVEPAPAEFTGATVTSIARLGKRVVLGLEHELYVVIHLMVAGRLHWVRTGAKTQPRGALAEWGFDDGRLILTEAGTKRRASIHLLRGAAALRALDPGGIEPLDMDFDAFWWRLTQENHTLKRALTDPGLFAGIGNAYSDEILHAAQLSPLALTQSLAPEDARRLFAATQTTLRHWQDVLLRQAGDDFPSAVTAFRDDMAVHGRFGKPCPRCGAPVQRIVYADNETNYCARCQTGGRLLADRALSRLLKKSWPRSLDE